MKLSDLNSKLNGFQILRNLVDCAIDNHFYPPPGYSHHTLLCIDKFHKSNHHQMPLNLKSNNNQSDAYIETQRLQW